MYWADELAQKLKERRLPLEWVDDMKTPSGRIHVGSLRGVVVHDLVHKALKDINIPTRYTFLFEDSDPMDDIPKYLPKQRYEKYLGLPLFKVPSPEPGFKNYAEYFALEFKGVINAIGCDPEIIWTADLYTSGRMNSDIKTCLDKTEGIRKIYEELYKKPLAQDWHPFQVYCENCGKVVTTRVYDWDGEKVSYRCKIDAVDWVKGCENEGKVSPFGGEGKMNGKLPWKIEWAVKWKVIGVTVEGAGKDHMSAGGSHDLSSLICQRIINYPVPYPVPYEFFLVGGRKMSSSKGLGSSALEMSEILPPEILRFLMVKTRINQAINFDPSGDTIPKLFDEYQIAAQEYKNNPKSDTARIFEFSQVGKLKYPPEIRFQSLTQWVQMPNMEEEIKRAGFSEWVQYAKIWVERFAPEQMRFSIQKDLPDRVNELTEFQKKYLIKVVSELDKEWGAEEFQKQLYTWAKDLNLPSNEAFSSLYIPLLDKDYGPKAAWLILKEDKNFIKKRFMEAISATESKTTKVHKLNHREIFTINNTFSTIYPNVSIGIAILKDVKINKNDHRLEQERLTLLDSLKALTTEQLGQYPEIISYRKLYKATGIDWHSRRPSPEALLRRVALNKELYTVNTCVDAYNLIVMKHRVSVGVFDLDKINFPTELRISQAGEEILLLGDEKPTHYKEGEVAYFDQQGGYNMDFNYRDAKRTAVTNETKNLYINVDGIFDITPEKVEQVLRETCDIIIKYCGGKVELFGIETAI